jgi:tetracycline resistance efflux pump
MEGTIYSLLPPFVAIVMVLVTRRVLLSLGAGIISAALLIEDFAPVKAFLKVYESVKATFVSDGALNT